jgi:2-haloalkanoic acid dehalogenase type II
MATLPIRAITLDLDDTLWPIEPVMLRAEAQLEDWMKTHCPQVAAAFPIPAMRALREQTYLDHPHLAHDFTALRKISLRQAFSPHGLDEEWVERAFGVFYSARNEVECYVDAIPALEQLAQRWPLVSISNGNADLERIGLKRFFQFSLTAREHGVAKPHADIFHSACRRLGLPPGEVLHVGDDPILDVVGAHQAGMRTAWINRTGAAWTHEATPEIQLTHLGELVEHLQIHARAA